MKPRSLKKSLLLLFILFFIGVKGLELPGSCKTSQYYDSGVMMCQSCPANVSMVVSQDGFSCTCEEHSVPVSIGRCRPCNATEVVSVDGRSCVPRRCQASSGKLVCRKCPVDYITVTHGLDGSPLKEMQCVKCARGYRPYNNVCVRCESCVCAQQEIVVRGRCLPKRYVNDRPKYDETKMHPNELLDIVKHEYFCTKNDLLACRHLASECVRRFYSLDLAGPCRLWIQPKIPQPKGLAKLSIETTLNEKDPTEIDLARGMNKLNLALGVFTSEGRLEILRDPDLTPPCFLPLSINIGKDYSIDCRMNISQLQPSFNETLSPFLYTENDLKVLPVLLRQTNGQYVQRGTWPGKFRRYFIIHNSLSFTSNMTNTIYLRTLLIRLRIERNKLKSTSLQLHISIEAQYAGKSPLSQSITTTLRVEHDMPSAGVLRGLEIWGGVLGALLSLYAVAQWRGNLRRGGLHFTIVPYMAGAIADALYFAAWFSTLHALAAEAGALGLTLPLSRSEEYMIRAFVYSAVGLKALKVAWINWNQCRCDIFFMDWSEYNPPMKDTPVIDKSDNWRTSTLAREWSRLQTKRRTSPAYTVPLTLIIVYLMRPWHGYLPQNQGYKWAVGTLAWWSAYVIVTALRWLMDRVLGAPTAALARLCTGLGLSLLVFQEEYYAHYVHGRNDDSDARSLAGPLAACRVVCAPQLRVVYKQLSTPGLGGLVEKGPRKVLLSKFLAAFFERALDGLSWVASERTVLERLLDVELVAREPGNTSALLYDPGDGAPSCFNVTWWGEEWSLGSFDAMIYGYVFMTTGDTLVAGLVTLVAWQIMKLLRSSFGNKNQREKTDVDLKL
ncbi:uncharacterized protein LOC126374615 [Pectinophora gossypiella]|uniref:uncharacterized protein LOC126374615 n=1 Tax=Pectinophora gossypiella TaxID=13191 RepID=UPI00214F3DBA|nr:uncharacterized protein LOC126374615 [Pectinophora gossypiella]